VAAESGRTTQSSCGALVLCPWVAAVITAAVAITHPPIHPFTHPPTHPPTHPQDYYKAVLSEMMDGTGMRRGPAGGGYGGMQQGGGYGTQVRRGVRL